MSLQTQLRMMLENQKQKLRFVPPPKKITKKQTKLTPIHKSKPKKIPYKVLVQEPIGLLPSECASLRALVHIIDPEIKGELPNEKWELIISYWKDLILKYNTIALRASIPEQATHEEDSDEEAERTGINLDETDNEADEDAEDGKDEFKDFIASEDDDEGDDEQEGDEGEEDEYEEEEDENNKQANNEKKRNHEEEENEIKEKDENETKKKKPKIVMEEELEIQKE